jgi:transcriptional regulator with XRE-family HTH domain
MADLTPPPGGSDPALSPRAMCAAELRHQRERAGLTQTALGELLFIERTLIAKMESGERRIKPQMAEMLDRVLDTGGFFVRHLAASRATLYPEHFADIVESEATALTIREWEPSLVPGLLQIPAYARAVIQAYDPVIPYEVVDERVKARLARAEIFNDPMKPLYWAVLDEAAIRRPCGGPAVMAAQLRHISGMIRRNRIIVQVVPYGSGAHAGLEGALRLMTFEDSHPVAYAQGQESGSYIDDPATVSRCSFTYDLLRAAALPPEASLSLVEAVAEEYENASQPGDGGMA